MYEVGGDEGEVEVVEINGGYGTESQEWEGEDSNEAVDAVALLLGEDLPPPDGGICQEHGRVQWHHC